MDGRKIDQHLNPVKIHIRSEFFAGVNTDYQAFFLISLMPVPFIFMDFNISNEVHTSKSIN